MRISGFKIGSLTANIRVKDGETLDFPDLEELCGMLHVAKGGMVNMPNLKRITGELGQLLVGQGGEVNLPALESVSGTVSVNGDLLLPKLREASFLELGKGASFRAPELAKVDGAILAKQCSTAHLPALEYAGQLSAQDGAAVHMPMGAHIELMEAPEGTIEHVAASYSMKI